LVTLGVCGLRAEDWPEYRGKGRLGVWNETGILEKFPEGGLKVLWRTPVKAGYAGPAVADGRVFVSDFNRDFLAAVRQAMQAGKSVDQAAAGLSLPDKYKDYDMTRARANVEAIYAELKK